MPRKLNVGRTERADDVAKAVGAAIKEARIVAGLSQRDVAAALGVSRQLYADIESGRVSPRIDQVDAIATACNALPTTIIRRSVALLEGAPTGVHSSRL